MTADSSGCRRRVLLLSLPFSSLHYPSIGLSLLKPILAADGFEVTLRYEFLRFADAIGADCQRLLDDEAIFHALIGEWIFAGEAHPDTPFDLGYLTEILQRRFGPQFSLERMHAVLTARRAASGFLDACLEAVVRDDPDLVGFTTSFQQNCASLALARRIKALRPATLVVFGGANCRDEMGAALLRQYPFIDAVCVGEGDAAFPAYVRRVLADGGDMAVPGMIERARPIDLGGAASVDLDGLPYPDFDDFFAQHAASAVAGRISLPTALFETSRGCWWGQRHHCTFCGINGSAMAYRSKSQDRAYQEVVHLAARFGPELVNVDAILDLAYFNEFLPRLGREGPAITAYYELKANITPAQMTALALAGILKIQPGIEALDTEVLRLMRKGCTMLQNVQTLKLAAENGVFVEWNLLHGFPGETAESYRRTAALIPALAHLQAPGVCGAVRADRFSPYWARPEAFGISVRPNPAYAYIYPFAPDVVAELAYHFDMVVPQSDALASAVAAVQAAVATWRAGQRQSRLTLRECGDGAVEVQEGRLGRAAWTRRFTGAAGFLLSCCWQSRSRRSLIRDGEDMAAWDAALAELLALGLVLAEGDRLLALPLRQPGYAAAPSWGEIRSGHTRAFTFQAASLDPAGAARQIEGHNF